MRIFISKAIKFLTGLCLLPLIPPLFMGIRARAGEFNARLIYLENPLSSFLGGLVIWTIFALLFHPPKRIYVFAHELTHALFVKLCGGKVKKITVRRDSGMVLSDRSNFLISLAPYLFPFYAALWGVGGFTASFLPDFSRWQPLFWGGFGFAMGYHWTMTGRMMTTFQTDFSSQGYFFSFVLIIVTNLFLLMLLLTLLPTPSHFPDHFMAWCVEAAKSYKRIFRFILELKIKN